jgi:glucokinase
MLLAGDIGGTKTRLAIISPDVGPREPLAETTFPSARYPSLEAVVRDFLAQVRATCRQPLPLDRASFGVAGPVVVGRATVTNLPWVIEATQLSQSLDIPCVRLLNDLEAIASSVPWLSVEKGDVETLTRGQPIAGGTIGVIAPGTGLGEAFLTWDGSRYRAYPSEGGHTDFGPTNEFEMDLLRHLQSRFGRVSYERLCCGIGLPNIYAYLKDKGYAEEPSWLAEQLAATDDPTPVIVGAALSSERSCEICVATLHAFVSILGAETGNLALKVLSVGGIYLGGGIPPRILPALQHERFLHAFRNKGRMSVVLERMPVHVILNPKAALLGAAYHALQEGGVRCPQ